MAMRIRPAAASKQGHGTRACYMSGCREAECVEANTRYMRGWRSANPGYAFNAIMSKRPAGAQVRRRAANGTRGLEADADG